MFVLTSLGYSDSDITYGIPLPIRDSFLKKYSGDCKRSKESTSRYKKRIWKHFITAREIKNVKSKDKQKKQERKNFALCSCFFVYRGLKPLYLYFR